MLKNFVIIRHMQDSGKYLFRVPNGISLSAGDKIVCDTARGTDQMGECCCDSFAAEPEMMCRIFGTQVKKLRFVTGKVEYERFEIAKGEEEYEELFEEE